MTDSKEGRKNTSDSVKFHSNFNKCVVKRFHAFNSHPLVDRHCLKFKKSIQKILDSDDDVYWDVATYNPMAFMYFQPFKIFYADMVGSKNSLRTVVLKLKFKDTIINYAYLYYTNNFETPEFICTSPSYLSQDGEFRKGWLRFGLFEILCSVVQNQGVWEYIYKKYTSNKAYEFDFDYFATDLSQKRKELHLIEKHVFASELYLNILAFVWLQEKGNIHKNMYENHTNPKFKNLLFGIEKTKDDRHYREYIREQPFTTNSFIPYFTRFELKAFKRQYNQLLQGGQNADMLRRFQFSLNIQLGQKIIPLNYEEVVCQNPAYRSWREIFAYDIVRNILYNRIAIGLPVLMDWFYILNSTPSLYDNDAQKIRLRHSNVGKEISRRLYHAEKFTKEVLNQSEEEDEDEMEFSTDYISDEFRNLSALINEPINYTKENIIMSDVSICMVLQRMGRTLTDILQLIGDRNQDYVVSIGDIFSKYDIFAMYIFNIVYTLYCLNQNGIIHGDLHLNNVSIHIPVIYSKPINTHILYIIHDMAYVLPMHNALSCIFDFSRCIFNSETVEKTEYAAAMHDRQCSDIMAMYAREFPAFFAKYRSRIQTAYIEYPDYVFQFYTAYDMYNMMQKLIVQLKRHKTADKIMRLCEQILNKTRTVLTDEFEKFLNVVNKERVVNPNLRIINTIFAQFHVKTPPDIDYANIVIYQDHLRYRWDDLDNLSPLFHDYSEYDPATDQYTVVVPHSTIRRSVTEKKNSYTGAENVRLVADRQRRELDGLFMRPPVSHYADFE